MWVVILMYALFASVFTVGKVTLHSTQPFFLTGIRMLFAGSILLLFQYMAKPEKFTLRMQHLPLLILIALFNVFITNSFEFWGLQYMSSAKTCLIYSLSPFVSIFLSYVFLKEMMTAKKWIGLGIGCIGSLLIFAGNRHETNEILPEIAVSISAFSAVFGWIFMKKLINTYNYSFVMANAISFVLGGIFSLIFSLFTENWQPFPITAFLPFLLGMVYIAIIHNVICYNLYAFSLKKFSITFMTFAGFTNPIFTAFYGKFFLNEPLTLNFFTALIIIFVGLYLYFKEEKAGLPSK